jgi:hypothetical protein
MTPRSRRGRAYLPLAAAGALAALAVDVRSLLFDASLRYDEINVVANVVTRPYGGLQGPLDYGQSAPIGWLWLTKGIYELFGRHELPLRAPALLAVAAAFALLIVLARRLLPAPAALVAVALVVTNFYVNFYSYNVKPYALDLLCTLGLVLAGLAARRGGRAAVTRFWVLAAVTALLSFPAIFTAAGVATVLTADRLRTGWTAGGPRVAAGSAGLFALGGLPWVAVVAAQHALALRAAAGNGFLHEYFESAFPPVGAGPTTFLNWIGTALYSYAQSPFTPGAPYLGLALGVAGAVWLVRRHGTDGALVLAPAAVGFALAAAGAYPMQQRLGLYAVPLVAIAAASLLTVPVRSLRGAAVPALAGLLLLAVIGQAALGFRAQQASRRTYTQTREVFAYVGERLRPGDVVLATASSEPAFLFYGPRYGVPPAAAYVMSDAGLRCDPPALTSALAGARRVWLVFAFAPPPPERAEVYRALGRRLGTPGDRLTLRYGTAAVYDLAAGPEPAAGDARLLRRNARAACLAVVPRPLPFPPPS